jgi:uncharacterized protein YabE (DUF348 family)
MKRVYISVLLLVLTISAAFLITQGIKKTVILAVNGQSKKIQTSAWTVGQFLEEQGISLREEDEIDSQLSKILVGNADISIQQASWITINDHGVTHTTFSRFNSVQEIFSNLKIDLAQEDLLYLDGKLVSTDAMVSTGSNHSLQILKSEPVLLRSGDTSRTFHTSAPTLGQGLWLNGVTLKAGDHLDPPIDSPIDGSVEVVLQKSKEITIRFSGGRIISRTSASTVRDALWEAGVTLQDLDYSRPGENAPIPEDGSIQVIRVREEQYLESEPIPYATETQPAADLEIDNRSVIQAGVLGLMTKRIRVRYEDEQEISRQVEDEYISQLPQAEIIGFGTKIVPHTLDTPGGQITYWRALDMYAISYNVTSNGGYGTATGVPLAKGVAAIDPSYIPYGTRMYVPGYGQALAADTGGGIQGRMIDLGYLDEDYVSWHQWVKVYFLWPPPENVVWTIP